ncbi:ankyrin repeat domain-containing protein [bacterium]|nr:ankyrin repeat domain-containing protein [bacterium]
MLGKSFVKIMLFVLLLSIFSAVSAETLAVMEITDNSAKIHPDVVKGSKDYIIKLLGSVGKYTIIPDSTLEGVRKRSPEWAKCVQMECQVEIGKAVKADIIVVPAVEYFAGIFTLTVNYIYVDGKRKTEAGAVDFNGTAAGMKKALESVVFMIHGKKTETPVFVEQNKELEKYKAENFKEAAPEEYAVPEEPVAAVPAPVVILPGSAEFSSDKQGISVTLDVSGTSPKTCTVPCTIQDIEPGTHTVRFELAGHTTKDETINIRSNEKTSKKVSLIPVIKSLEEINNELIAAAKADDLEQAKALLSKGASINYHDSEGLSPLLIALLGGQKIMAAYFSGRGAQLSSVESGALMRISVDKDDVWIASTVAKQKNVLNLTFENGQTVLWLAAKKGAWNVFDEYLRGGVNTGIKDASGQTLLAWAIETGNTEVIERFKKHGIRLSFDESDSMLKQAVVSEDVEKVRALALLKPNVNKVYDDGLTLLWYAAVKDRTDIAELLLKAGAKAEISDKTGKNLITYCIERRKYEMAKLLRTHGAQLKTKEAVFLLQRGLVIGDGELVNALINVGVNVNTKFSDGLSALWIAAFTNNRDMIDILAAGKANMNVKDSLGKTVLMWAVENDKKEVANALIKHGANLNLMDNKKRTALMSAVLADKPRMVQMLVMNNAQIDLKDEEGNSAILIAASRGNTGLVKMFLEHGAFVNASDTFGNTPILISLYKNFDDLTELLIEKGADLNKANSNGETPLIVAAKKGRIKFVRNFIEKGASIDSADKNGDTALILAKRENRHDIVLYLLNKDAVIEKRSEQDELMSYAALNSYHDIAANLIKRGISVNRRFSDGLFPLWYAVRNGDVKMMEMFFAAGVDLEAKNKDGETVLLYACAKREEHVVVALLNKGADFTIVDKQKSTPLMIVAGRGFEKAVQILISKRADLNAKDDKGRTAVTRAQYTGNYHIVDMLKRAGAYD